MVWGAKPTLDLKEIFLQDPSWELSMPAAPGRTGSCPSRIMSVARLSSRHINQDPKRARVELPMVMGFSDEDKIGTVQPHDDALVITL